MVKGYTANEYGDFLIASIKGLACSNSPKDGVCIQTSFSLLEMFFSRYEKVFSLPLIQSLAFWFLRAAICMISPYSFRPIL